jgi:glycine hydroxymethyltransferase
MPTLAGFVAGGLYPAADQGALAQQVSEWRSQFTDVHFTADRPS